MIGILFLILSIWIGFLFEETIDALEDNFWAKLAFAIITGTLFATWLVYAAALLLGFNYYSLAFSLIVMASCAGYAKFAKNKNGRWFAEKVFNRKSIPVVHVALLLFIMPYFIFGMWETKSGDILYSANYTDMPYHISMVSAFLEHVQFPPGNPQAAGAKMIYHFMVNFHSAILNLGGIPLMASVIIPQLLFAFALATMLYYFYRQLLSDNMRTGFAAILFIMGHIALGNLIVALLGHPLGGSGFSLSSWVSVRNELLYPFFNFLNPIINFFHPQRPFLFGLPLGLIVLAGTYRTFLKEESDYRSLFMLSCVLGLTPLFHIHTFLVVGPIFVLAALCRRRNFIKTVACLLPLLLAVPQILFLFSQPKTPNFSGFDVYKIGGGINDFPLLGSFFLARIIFWLRVAGFPLLLGLAGCIVCCARDRGLSLQSKEARKGIIVMLFTAIPFMFFLLINFYRISPAWGDSNKFFLYFDLMLCFFSAILLGSLYKKNFFLKLLAILIITLGAIAPSLLEAYVIFSRPGQTMFTPCEKATAQWIRENTPKEAVFLTSDDIIHYVPPLAARQVVDGSYTPNTGFRKPGTENDIKKIYSTGDIKLIKKYKITHVLIGPQERRHFKIDERAFAQYNLIYNQSCKGDSFKIYDTVTALASASLSPKAPPKPGDKVFLSDIEPDSAEQSFGHLMRDANIDTHPISLNGKKYAKGLGTHAHSEIIYSIDKKMSFFEADIGLDDSEAHSKGSIVFKVLVDDSLRYTSPVMKGDTPTEHVKVPLNGASQLMLIVEDAGDGDTCDHASWADAVFIY